MKQAEPNVVSPEAAETVRAFVFDRRNEGPIDPREIVARMIAEGHGTDFPPGVRRKRLRTWALQVLRRLRKHGWLGAAVGGIWPPTAALKTCTDSRALAKRSPRRSPRRERGPRPARPESWPYFVQDWVLRHRDAEFGVVEVAVAVVQHGYGTGDLGGRLDGAREIAERELGNLEEEGLLRYDRRSEMWSATDLLKTWPTAD